MEIEQNNNENNEDNNNNNNNQIQNNNNAPKGGRGRRKIEMKKITNQEDLMISFTKRRSGIFKKASELSTLSGAEVGFLVFSPTGKPFSFGSPTIDRVMDKFTDSPLSPPYSTTAAAATPLLEAHRRRRVAELGERHDGLFRDLDVQRALQRNLKDILVEDEEEDDDGKEEEEDNDEAEVVNNDKWWDAPLEGLGEKEILERKEKLHEVYAKIAAHVKDRVGEASTSVSASAHFPNFPPPPPPPPPSSGGVFI